MQNLTIEQLNDIIALMDLEKIKTALEKYGYRHASKHDKLEFDLMKIIEKERTTATNDFEDTFDDHSYFAEVFEGVEGYEQYTFIVVTRLAIFRNKNNQEFPDHVDLYTTAPINEEYEKAMEEIKKCKYCGKKFHTYDIYSMNGKAYCKPCFQEVFSKNVRRK